MIEVFKAAVWLATLPFAQTDPQFVSGTLCLAQAIYHEARGEPFEGQSNVALVVMHRVADPRWPDSVCEVVYQPAQFSFTAKPHPIREPTAFRDSLALAAVIYMETTFPEYDPGPDPILYFYNPRKVKPVWSGRLNVVEEVGQHVFLSDGAITVAMD